MLVLLALTGLFAAIDPSSCFFSNATVDILINKRLMAITVWPLPLSQQASECSALQSSTGLTINAIIGSYTFSQADFSSWSMEQPSLLLFACPTTSATTDDCQKNLTNSTVVQLKLTYSGTELSLVTTNVRYALTNNSACWADPKISVDYVKGEVCFLVEPSACDIPQRDDLAKDYQAFILLHLDTVPDIYLNVTLSSHGSSATLPNFVLPYEYTKVTQFCYSCDGVRYPDNDWLTNSDTYNSCVETINILKLETDWSATLIIYVNIPGTTKTTTTAATSSLASKIEVVTPDTAAKAGISSAIKVSAEYAKCYNSVVMQIYFGILVVLLERDTASICNDILDYRDIVLQGEVAEAKDSLLSTSDVRISLSNAKFTFKQTKQFFPCTSVACLRDMNMLLFSNLSLAGSFDIRYFSSETIPENIIPYPASVQRTCFYRATLFVASDLVTLRLIGRSPTNCSITEGPTKVNLDIYIHSGPSISSIVLERLFVRMSGEVEYAIGKDVVFTCGTMYQRGVYVTENVPKQDIEYYMSGSCPSKLKSVLEAYGNGTGVYAEVSFDPIGSTTPAGATYKEYQYIFIKESYLESTLISTGVAAIVFICGVVMLTLTHNKGHIMEP